MIVPDISRAILSQIYPKDFEYYMVALELVNGAGDTIDYFAFPVLPTAITKSENKRISIKKSYRSTLVLTSTAFTPQDITIKGNFGRSFKILVGVKEILNGVAFRNSTKAGVFELSQLANGSTPQPVNQFEPFVKTGYGATKLLQSIIHKSDGSDDTGPWRLYFYNFALGESYLVVAPSKSLTLEQNDSTMNMIWNYTLNLTIIAPLESIKNKITTSSTMKLLTKSAIQSNVNRVGREMSSYLRQFVMGTILDTFKSITRFDLQSYFTEFSSFITEDYQKIVDYTQNGADLPASVVTRLESLKSDMLQVNDLFNIYIDRLSAETSEMWEVLDTFESTKVTLLTVANSERWMRTTKSVLQSDAVKNDSILRQGQSFENLSGEIGNSTPDNSWSDLAINNDVKEEDYSFEGGNKLKISFTNSLNFNINSVIDSLNGEKIYGLDLDRTLTFASNDLSTLSYKETILQQTEILVGLIKGSVPEFPLDGIGKDLVGVNKNAIQYPILLRQQAAVFEKDDRYKSVLINNLSTVEDSLVIDMQITTRLNEVLDQQLVL